MKVSKVVLIVVALHVLVIGGIFVFEGCSRAKSPTPQIAENESLPGDTNTIASATPAPEQNLTAAMPAPAPAPTPVASAPAPVAPAKTYAVKKGDSLYKIAKAEKVTVDQLAKANNLSKTSMLKIGQKLNIPSATAKSEAPATMMASATAPAATAAGGAYEVQIGDSLWKIAKAQGTTIAALKQANNLSSDALKVGQKLTIPAKAAPATATTAAPAVPATPAAASPAVIAPGIATN